MNAQKQLEQGSKYEHFDKDGDGVVTDEEFALERDIIGYETTGQLLADIAPTYFVAISALVASFFGAQAYTKVKNK